MEVKSSLGSMSVNELYSQIKADRVEQQQTNTQGSVDTSSRKAEATSYEESRTWSVEVLDEKIGALNHLTEAQFTSLKFERHEKLDRTIVTVIDRDTEEVIKEIPPQEFLDMISSMLEFAGIIIDEKI
ncbi:flagellar protein FlaG [Evansella cellulosilytica]|uniref:Flagellar protein FlaG protein n=1 Tax=Evansella cellulosilytica (strain ATCC 21833 / DSM 2522 / FERM P-1141 / JCM 9156 / N-4) TaxID=649639 RepID=E6TS74_EVAC2|nr:flagellar protein FlaG [Evansella cellulosilytica]ADU31843.1 flagellar protein FlaG protein [Evansella cellulosilytica DSM 2522]